MNVNFLSHLDVITALTCLIRVDLTVLCVAFNLVLNNVAYPS